MFVLRKIFEINIFINQVIIQNGSTGSSYCFRRGHVVDMKTNTKHANRVRRSKSEDYTMATWGGSTVDNLESIEEDEDGIGAGQGPHKGEEDEEDGYPSDGIVQVEEEEEAQESDDHDTYTIEEDFNSHGARGGRQPPSLHSQQHQAAEGRSARSQKRRAACRGAPLMEQMGERSLSNGCVSSIGRERCRWPIKSVACEERFGKSICVCVVCVL